MALILWLDCGSFHPCGCSSLIIVPSTAEFKSDNVKAPPMAGPTWTRVRFTLGLDCLPTLSQRTASLLPCVFGFAYCPHAHDSMIRMIQGCISMSHSVMSPWGLLFTPYSVCLHGTLYPMTDYCIYDWWRVPMPASADALQASLRFYY